MTHQSLRDIRLHMGLTQAQLAEELRVSTNTYARWERNEMSPPGPVWRLLEMLAPDYNPCVSLLKASRITIDSHHEAIVERLNGYLDPKVFEECAVDLLRGVFPGIVLVGGVHDRGFDGAILKVGSEPTPLVVTTSKDLKSNFSRNLSQIVKRESPPTSVVFATSRRMRNSTREDLFRISRDRGLTLWQIFDQEYFARALYRDANWTRRLLGLVSTPPALSRFPEFVRTTNTDTLFGRDAEIKLLQSIVGDSILAGPPGSGKTSVLSSIAAQGGGIFLSSEDPREIADACRSQQPKTIFIDDANIHLSRIQSLLRFRAQNQANFRTVLASWPGSEETESLRNLLQVPDRGTVHLGRLPADTIIEVVKSTGLHGPDWLLHAIQLQAGGLPGLAVTLANACRSTREIEFIRRVLSGDELLSLLLPKLREAIGDDVLMLLGAISIGGKTGMQLKAIAEIFRASFDSLQHKLARLSAAGIVHQHRTGNLSIQPAALAPALCASAFFGEVASPDIALELFTRSPSKPDSLDVLIGVHIRGKRIPEFEELMVGHASIKQWRNYASAGANEARFCLEENPDQITALAPSLLNHLPEQTIPHLLVEASKNLRNPSKTLEHPLRILEHWVSDNSISTAELVRRRSTTIKCLISHSVRENLSDSRSALAIVRTFVIAFDPNLSGMRVDPGLGRTVTYRRRTLDIEATQHLAELWKESVELVCDAADRSRGWAELLQLHPKWHNSWDVERSRQLELEQKDFAKLILEEVAKRSRRHPAIQRRIRSIALQTNTSVAAVVDPAFEALHPDRDSLDRSDNQQLIQTTIAAWKDEYLAMGPEEVAKTLEFFEDQSALSGTREWFPLAPSLCSAIADSVADPLTWAREIMKRDCSNLLVEPFLSKTNPTDGALALSDYVSNKSYRHLFLRTVFSSGHSAAPLWEMAISLVPENLDCLPTLMLDPRVSSSNLQPLMQHPQVEVATSAAISLWEFRENERAELQANESWRAAVLKGLLVNLSPAECEAMIDILERCRDLALRWMFVLMNEHEISSEPFSTPADGTGHDLIETSPVEDWVAPLEGGNEDTLDVDTVREMIEDEFDLAESSPSHSSFEVATKLVRAFSIEEKRQVLDGMRIQRWPAEKIVGSLVEDDPEAYAYLLAIKRLKEFHLIPFGKLSREYWAEFVVLARDTGIPIEKILEASLPTSWSWEGRESDTWQSRQEYFESLFQESDESVCSLARRLAEDASKRRQRAEEEEKEEEIWGRDRWRTDS